MAEKSSIKLGQKYRDLITGFEGTASAIAHYLNGCDRVLLEAIMGDNLREYWFDITRLEAVKLIKKEKKPGGPQSVPTKQIPR